MAGGFAQHSFAKALKILVGRACFSKADWRAGGSNDCSGIPQQRVNTFISSPKFLGHHTGFSDGGFEVKTITSTSDKTSPIRLFAQGHPDRTDSPTSHFLGMKDHRSANVGL